MRRLAARDWGREKNKIHDPVDAETLGGAAKIVDDVRLRGETALREHAERLGDLASGEPLSLSQGELESSLNEVNGEQRALLHRCKERIASFAQMQLESIRSAEMSIPGGKAGQSISPLEQAGCYAPGGRFPLPSSVLMTAVTARVAGVRGVAVASPKAAPITKAAAAVAGADSLLCVGGAQAIAAMAFGIDDILPSCDAIVGPGNRWVTAAKQLLAGRVSIDMLAGPSELLVLADQSAKASWVAADLLAQAEHDPDALPILVSLSRELSEQVQDELDRQLANLPTADTARAALQNGYILECADLEEAIALCNELAPEHLELSIQQPERVVEKLAHYGGLFIGEGSAEVFGDYGAGPNHVLPTGRTARFTGGLSVFNFLRVRTWMKLDSQGEEKRRAELIRDSADLARLEGLEAHARAAEKRLEE